MSQNKESQYINNDWFAQFPLGQEEPGIRNWIDDAEKKLGGEAGAVTYFFNTWRYRGEAVPDHGVSASFGCSHALGYGVNNPYAEILGFANCAVNGISNDAIVRMAYTYCQQFFPRTIVVLWTIPHRREYVDNDGILQKFRGNDNDALLSLQNEHSDAYNLQKNKLFLKNYCDAKNINLIEFEFEDNDHAARDGMHPGSDWHANMAAKIFEKLEQL